MISKKLGAGLLFCSLVFTAAAAQAFPGDNNRGQKGGNEAWGQQLTPEQRKQAEKIFNDNFNSMNDTRDALAAKRQELNQELESDSPDTAKIEQLSREIGELRGKMLAARVAVRSQLAREGLPSDFYGPNVSGRKQKNRGPEVWHGGHHRGPRGWHHGSENGWWGGPGMMGGCPGMMGYPGMMRGW